ncbi:hypothetical protein BH09PSE5_BH09PSE5_33820 [soil metagenome]
MIETTTHSSYLPEGLPIPVPEADGLSAPHWNGLKEGRLNLQRCRACSTWQWGPEWICHKCHSFDVGWQDVEPQGRIYSWTRVWHPTHSALNKRGAYIVVVVELPEAGGVRVVGNLLGDAQQPVEIDTRVSGVFEKHPNTEPAYALLHWKVDPASALTK